MTVDGFHKVIADLIQSVNPAFGARDHRVPRIPSFIFFMPEFDMRSRQPAYQTAQAFGRLF